MTSAFLDFLVTEQIGWRDGRPVFKTLRPLRYHSESLGRTVVVPAEFVTDLASVPRWFLTWWLAGGRAPRSAVLHDFPYQFGYYCMEASALTLSVTKAMADDLFWESMDADPISGTNALTRYVMWQTVAMFGRGKWEDTQRVRELNPRWTWVEPPQTP